MIEFTSPTMSADHRAIGSRLILGQAEGILMERFGMGTGEAYDYLRRESEHSNRWLVEVAIEVVRTRRIPTASGQLPDAVAASGRPCACSPVTPAP